METSRIQSKIKLLFEKISEPNYVMNTYYADSFINKISNSSDIDASNLVALPLLPDLLIHALQYTTDYHNTVHVFLSRILAIVSRKETHFCKILEKRRDKLLEFLNNITEKKMNPSLKVAYLEVALALTSHRSGVFWLLETELWKKILSLYDKNTTVFVLRLMYKFSAEFTWKLNDFDDNANLQAVLSYMLQPILELNIHNDVILATEEADQFCEKFEPMLQMLLSIVSKIDRICHENKIAGILLSEYNIATQLYILLERVRKNETTLLISRILLTVVLFKIFQTKPLNNKTVYVQEDFMDLIAHYFNTMQCMLQKRDVILVLDYCGNSYTVWRSIWHYVLKNSQPYPSKNVVIQNQMLLIYLVPTLVYVNSSNRGSCMTKDDITDYMSQFINMTCEHTARAAYALRDLIYELDMLSVTLQSVKRLTCFKDHLNDEQANLVFKTLFFALREYDPTNDSDDESQNVEEDFEVAERKMLVMTYVVDIVLSIVKNYNINWHESLEVICLNSVIHNILTKKKNLTCKFVVSSLNLLSMTVAKFLPPNLSLLMESQPGSAMHEIGDLIYTKIHDMHWEIRDSALELLHVCTEISFIKFPPIQKQLIEKNLISLAVTVAFNDYEQYVQVSALKCIGASSKVAPMWEQMSNDHPDVLEKLVAMLRHNQEGIVRKEACSVLCEVYQNLKLSSGFKNMLYEHMASSAMSDFHWEVQLNALKFWNIVIQSLLNDQGMLDGTFPPVTFSRETRKIVTLNETEVRKRLIKLLEELSFIGCLTVLLKLLHDDTEVEVMESAYAIANELNTILIKYKVSEHVNHIEGEPKTIAELECFIKDESELSENGEAMDTEISVKADNVIEGILKSDDMNLLASIYNKGMSLQNRNESALAPKLKLIKQASPYLFTSFMEITDCKKIISQKRDWKEGIRSFSSLLDDVLGIYEHNEEVNSLDCY